MLLLFINVLRQWLQAGELHNLLGDVPFFFMILIIFSYFVIDFLSIQKVIFTMIATNDSHPLWSCSIYQNAGMRHTDVQSFGSHSNTMQNKKRTLSLEDLFIYRD